MTIQIKEHDSIPSHIRKKAKKEIHRLKANTDRLRKWKGLRSHRGLYRLKLNRCYRMVVSIDDTDLGPYQIMHHSTFDKRY